uniref:Uncharacterized protein n=1 Tax=Clytia hemisphaerica TaxID=252671 RepID=A0A7M5WQZ1_9CNID
MSKRKNKDLSAFTPKLEGDGKHPKMLKGVTNEKRKEKLIPFDFDENDCDVIIEAKDKEVHLPSSFLEMVSGGRTLPMISKTDVTSERLIKVLSFYCPKISTNKLEFCNVAEVDDLFKISTTLHLKMFQDYLLEQIDVKYIESCQNFNEDLLVILNVFHKYDIQGYVRQIMIKEMILETLNHSLKPSFKTLDKKLQMEIIKNSVLKVYHSKFKSGFTDASMIFNFFELILHEDRVVDLSVKKDFLEPLKSPNIDIDLESITCPKNSPNCITLVVEERRFTSILLYLPIILQCSKQC